MTIPKISVTKVQVFKALGIMLVTVVTEKAPAKAKKAQLTVVILGKYDLSFQTRSKYKTAIISTMLLKTTTLPKWKGEMNCEKIISGTKAEA